MAKVNETKNATLKMELASLNAQIQLMKVASGKICDKLKLEEQKDNLSPVKIEKQFSQVKANQTVGLLASLKMRVANILAEINSNKTKNDDDNREEEPKTFSPVEFLTSKKNIKKVPGKHASTQV